MTDPDEKKPNENDPQNDEQDKGESPNDNGAPENADPMNGVMELLKQMQESQKEMQSKLDRYQNLESLLIKSGAIVNDNSASNTEPDSDNDADAQDDWLNSINIDKLNFD